MGRFLLAISLMAAAAGVLLTAPAEAAEKPKKASVIDLVAPMRVTVGGTLTIRGRNFSSVGRSNTVIFRSPTERVAFAKPRRAARRKLVVRVPGSVERILRNKDSKGVGDPTRLTIRVVVSRRYGKKTIRRNSPVVVSALRSGAPATCGTGADFDRDVLSNSLEASIKTDPCKADTDDDGVEDGFEYYSALDLNQRAVPYPGRRPFPNALDAADAEQDYDGDGLSSAEEFEAWSKAAASPARSTFQFYTADLGAPAFGGPYDTRPTFGDHALPLNYSDGDQATLDVGPGHPEYRDHLDSDGDGRLTDDERDVDGDGLSNFAEVRALMRQEHYPTDEDCGYVYKPALPRTFLQVDFTDSDSDGDGVWDGNDDQDSDGVANADEIAPPYLAPPDPRFSACDEVYPLPADGARDGGPTLRHPYNPCLPYRSETCARHGVRD